MKVTGQTITQLCFIRDIERKMERYNRLRWYRSEAGPNGPFELVTARAAEPATLQGGPSSGTYAGTSLRLRINGGPPVVVGFSADVALEEAVARMTPALPELEIWAQSGGLVLRTVATGSASSIEVLDSAGPTAASLLGLSVGEVAVGRDPHQMLGIDTTLYGFADHQADPSFYYQPELFNAGTEYSEPYGPPIPCRALDALAPELLVGGYVSLCDMSGNPLVGRRVIIYNALLPNRIVDGNNAWGVFRQSMEATVDARGFAEFVLVRGVEVDISIAGTGFTRHIRVPTDGAAVNLLDPALDVRDEFGIRQTPIDFAIRTTL